MYADIVRDHQQDYSLQRQHCLFAHEDLVYVDDNDCVVIIYNEIALCKKRKSCCQSMKNCSHFLDIDMLATQTHVKSFEKCLTSS